MYYSVRELYNTNITEDIMITEFFPCIDNEMNIYLPVSDSDDRFIMTLFEDIPIDGQDVLTKGIGLIGPKLSLTEYEVELNSLVANIEKRHQGRIRVSTKNLPALYQSYCDGVDMMDIAGVASITTSADYNNVYNIKFIPPEGVYMLVGFDTFCKDVKLILPQIVLDYATAMHMYSGYVEESGFDPKSAVDLDIILSSESLSDLVNKVDSCLDIDIREDEAEALVMNPLNMNAGVRFGNYFDTMNRHYGILNNIATYLLPYSGLLVNRVITKAIDKSGIVVNRPNVYIPETITQLNSMSRFAADTGIV